MNIQFKARFWKTGKWFIGLFIVMFCFRLLYGYLSVDGNNLGDYNEDFFSSIENLRKNYASEKSKVAAPNQTNINYSTTQKFEKTASVKTKSAEFEQDQKAIKTKTKAYEAVIQYEQNIGQKGNRQLHLLIGVTPALFDSFYVDIQKIGVVKDIEITKVDKTNEYRQLNAKKVSIEKTLQSLNDLKSKGGQIADFVALNDKILEIEEKLQGLGVELGNFDTENEFCTVKLSLYEGATQKSISLIHRVKVALEWTIKYFLKLVFALFWAAALTFILLLLVDKLNVIKAVLSKYNE
jgi:Domain of unknown function (DUF4349)